MKRIKVTIDKDGGVKLDAIGFQGAECEQATAELEASLGVMKNRKVKPERYRASVQTVTNK